MSRNTWSDGEGFSVASLNALKHAFQGEGTLTGGDITPGTADFDVDVTEATYIVDDSGHTATADTLTLSNPDAEDRVDLITATTVPDFNVVEGAVASTTDEPNAQDIPTDEVLIGLVYVDSEATEIAPADIFDGYKTPVQTVENWTTDGDEGTVPTSDGNGAVDMVTPFYVRQLYHIGLSMLNRGGYFGTVYPGVTAATGEITGSVSSATDEIDSFSGFDTDPHGISVDPADGTLWHVDYGSNTIYHLERSGREIDSFSASGGTPRGLAVDPADGTLWQVDGAASDIYHLERDGEEINSFSSPDLGPDGIAVDPADGTLWHTNDFEEEVYHLERDGTVIDSFSSPSSDPIGIDVDPADGTLWITNGDSDNAYHLDRDGTEIDSLTTPFDDPQGIAIDPADGTLWTTSHGPSEIYHLARHPSGDIVTVEGFDFVLPPRNTDPILPRQPNIWYIDEGASDPTNALDDDLIVELETP